MFDSATDRRIFAVFAALLEYPRSDVAEAARECGALVQRAAPEAARLLGEFHAAAAVLTPSRLEEVYTGTFDLDAMYHPYVGYHLFGESYKRSVFLLGLKERYRARGFALDGELPDHLAVLLRFLAESADDDLAAEIVDEAVLPALDKILGEDRSAEPAGGDEAQPDRPNGRVYEVVLEALRSFLQEDSASRRRITAEEASPVHTGSSQLG